MNRRPRLIAGLVTASVLVLTGCGGSGPQPGVAVSVGDEIVTEQDVDTAARGLCSFFADDVAQQGAVAYREVRRTVAVLQTLRTAVDELAAQTGADPGSDYRRSEASLESETADIQPAAEREALVRTLGSEPYVLAMVPAIGEALLREDGEVDPDPRGGQPPRAGGPDDLPRGRRRGVLPGAGPGLPGPRAAAGGLRGDPGAGHRGAVRHP